MGVQSVSWQAVNSGTINSALDTNTNPGGGWRIFPDNQNPSDTTNHATVLLRAVVTPAVSNLTVYFTSFDVRDPTQVMPLTGGSATAVDNAGVPQAGSLSFASALTDANGVATNLFTVTMQPGDNFRVVASCDPNFAGGYHSDTTSTTGGIIDGNGNPIASNYATDMLTVWRRLHVEVDSMAAVANNQVVRNITAISGSGSVATKLTLDQNLTTSLTPVDFSVNLSSSGNGRFENGWVKIGLNQVQTTPIDGNGDAFVQRTAGFSIPSVIITNAGSPSINSGQVVALAGQVFTVSGNLGTNSYVGKTFLVAGTSFTISTNTANTVTVTASTPTISVTLHDDDDDSLLPHSWNLSVLSAALNDAYITVVDDGGGSMANDENNAIFQLNLPGNSVGDQSSFQREATGANDFWVAYLLLSYQYTTDSDSDPDSEGGTGGVTWGFVSNTSVATGSSGTQVFEETIRDRLAQGATVGLEERVTAHEIGHQMGLGHWDTGEPGVSGSVPVNLMLRSLQTVPNSSARFVSQHLVLLRSRVHTPGQ